MTFGFSTPHGVFTDRVIICEVTHIPVDVDSLESTPSRQRPGPGGILGAVVWMLPNCPKDRNQLPFRSFGHRVVEVGLAGRVSQIRGHQSKFDGSGLVGCGGMRRGVNGGEFGDVDMGVNLC